MREMSDCDAWAPISEGDGVHRLCGTCGCSGDRHWPAAFVRGLGLSAPAAKRVAKAVADDLRARR